MKFQCVAIFAFFVLIHLTNAAPPFDVHLFLNELTEIHSRMGDLIQRAKYEIKDNELKGSIEPKRFIENTNDQNSYHQIENTVQAVVNQINPNDRNEGNFNEPQLNEEENFKRNEQIGDNVEQSYNLPNQNVGFGSEAQTKPENVNTETGVAVNEQNLRDSTDEDALNDELTPSQLTDQESGSNLPSQPIDITKSGNQENINKNEVNRKDIDQQLVPTETDHIHDWGEETNNNEGEVDEDGGWFGNAIDSIVNFFS